MERGTSTALSVSGLPVIKELYREQVTLSVSKDIDQGIMTMQRYEMLNLTNSHLPYYFFSILYK